MMFTFLLLGFYLTAGLCQQHDPVSYFNFNQNTTEYIIDSSYNQINGTINNGVQIVAPPGNLTCDKVAKINNFGFISLEDVDKFVEIPLRGITIGAFVRLDEVIGTYDIFSIYDTNDSYRLSVENGTVKWLMTGYSGFVVKTDTQLIKNDTWTHVAGTYNSTNGNAKLYINGTLTKKSTGHIRLTTQNFWGFVIGQVFSLYIDEFKMYNVALNDDEISLMANACLMNDEDER